VASDGFVVFKRNLESGLRFEVAYILGLKVNGHLGCNSNGVVGDHKFLDGFVPVFITYGALDGELGNPGSKVLFL